MSLYADNANWAKSAGRALQGLAFCLGLALLSMVSLRLGRFEAALTFLPLIGVFLWPRGSSSSLSGLFIFIAGLSVDILSAGPIGMWALIYFVVYGLVRPQLRVDFVTRDLWIQFSFVALLVGCLLYIMGWFFIEGQTAVVPIIMQVGIVIGVFPFVYFLKKILSQLTGEPEGARFY